MKFFVARGFSKSDENPFARKQSFLWKIFIGRIIVRVVFELFASHFRLKGKDPPAKRRSSMSTLAKIRDYIQQLPRDSLFTSRDLVCFGTRPSVDNAVYNLVKAKEIIRVARGMFHRPERRKPVSVLEAAKAKAQSFGREIITHALDIACKMRL